MAIRDLLSEDIHIRAHQIKLDLTILDGIQNNWPCLSQLFSVDSIMDTTKKRKNRRYSHSQPALHIVRHDCFSLPAQREGSK